MELLRRRIVIISVTGEGSYSHVVERGGVGCGEMMCGQACTRARPQRGIPCQGKWMPARSRGQGDVCRYVAGRASSSDSWCLSIDAGSRPTLDAAVGGCGEEVPLAEKLESEGMPSWRESRAATNIRPRPIGLTPIIRVHLDHRSTAYRKTLTLLRRVSAIWPCN